MPSRTGFLRAAAVSLLASGLPPSFALAATPPGLPAPTASPQPNAWDLCEPSTALPYDRPIGLKMPTLDGPDFDLAKERGKIVILNVFASWCGPCVRETPALVAAAHKYADKGVRVIGINDRETDNTVRTFRDKYGIDYPIAMDRHGGFTGNLEVGAHEGDLVLPVTFLMLRSGYLSCYVRGNMSEEQITYRIEAMLRDDPLAAPSTAP